MRVRGLTDEDGDFSDLQKKKVSDVPATEIEEKRMQELAELQSQCNTLSKSLFVIRGNRAEHIDKKTVNFLIS